MSRPGPSPAGTAIDECRWLRLIIIAGRCLAEYRGTMSHLCSVDLRPASGVTGCGLSLFVRSVRSGGSSRWFLARSALVVPVRRGVVDLPRGIGVVVVGGTCRLWWWGGLFGWGGRGGGVGLVVDDEGCGGVSVVDGAVLLVGGRRCGCVGPAGQFRASFASTEPASVALTLDRRLAPSPAGCWCCGCCELG
jgi:hypothetical protein